MRIIRNVEYVRRRKRIARLASLIGFLLLGSTFLLIFKPDLVLMAYAILFLGFIVFNFGMQQLGKWSRSPRNDEALDARLRSLPDAKYTLIHYPRVGKRVVEHVLVHPGGVLAMTARELAGNVSVKDKRWRKTGGGFTRFFAMSGPQLGNPTADLEQDVEALETLISEQELEVDIYGAVVFLNDRVELEAEDPAYPALKGDLLVPFINAMEPDDHFRQADREALVAALSSGAGFEIEAAKSTRRPVRVKRRVA
jgi:hypothetical protein